MPASAVRPWSKGKAVEGVLAGWSFWFDDERRLGIVEGLWPGGGTLHDWLRGERPGGSAVETPAERNDSRPAPLLREDVPPGPSSLRVKAMSDVTRILSAIEQGDPHAAEQLLPLVYDELRKLAAAEAGPGEARPDAPGHGPGPRGLPAAGRRRTQAQHWNSRGHFFAAAAEAMRRILVDSARAKQPLKRGGGRQRVDLDDDRPRRRRRRRDDLLALDEALDQLAARRPAGGRAGQAPLLRRADRSSRPPRPSASRRATADRHWAYARAWLLRRSLGDEPSPSDDLAKFVRVRGAIRAPIRRTV